MTVLQVRVLLLNAEIDALVPQTRMPGIMWRNVPCQNGAILQTDCSGPFALAAVSHLLALHSLSSSFPAFNLTASALQSNLARLNLQSLGG